MKGKNKELDKVKVLILGSKEFPMGTNKGDDPLPSGGFEVYTENLVNELKKYNDIWPVVITRKFENSKSYENNGVEVHRVKWLKGTLFRGPSFNLFSFFKALFLKYDCILANGWMSGFFSLFLSKIKGCGVILRPGGNSFMQPQFPLKSLIKRMETFAYSHANNVVFGSKSEEDRFAELFGFLPKVRTIIPTGIGLLETKEREQEEIVISYVGRLVKVKGVEYLIEAARSLVQQFRLMIVGDGPERKSLMDLAEGDKRIEFLGFRTDVRDLLEKTDIFVLPSLSEGVPIGLLEAMAAGCACVVTRIGLPVSDGKDGLVVEPGDSSDLAIAIEKLMTDKDLRKAMQERGRQFIRENHSLEKMGEMYVDLFRDCKR